MHAVAVLTALMPRVGLPSVHDENCSLDTSRGGGVARLRRHTQALACQIGRVPVAAVIKAAAVVTSAIWS